jgi:hypothetical protein
MDPPLKQLGREWLSEEGRRDFTMPLPDGEEAVVRVERFVSIGDDGGEFRGTLEGYPDSSVNLSYRGSGEAGSIRIPSENRLIRVFPGPEGEVVLSEVELDEAGPPGLPEGLSIPEEPPPNFIPEPPPEIGGGPNAASGDPVPGEPPAGTPESPPADGS